MALFRRVFADPKPASTSSFSVEEGRKQPSTARRALLIGLSMRQSWKDRALQLILQNCCVISPTTFAASPQQFHITAIYRQLLLCT